jgi:ferric-dicitrate binding protein FerR (iron transport regulator)
MGPEADRETARVLTDALGTAAPDQASLDRMRSVVAREWQAATGPSEGALRRRRLRRVSYALAASFAAVALALWLGKPSVDSAPFGTISRINAPGLEVRSGLLHRRRLLSGDVLRVGDRLTAPGAILIDFAHGGTLRIETGSDLSITASAQLSLERGLIYVDVPPGASGPIRVDTRAGQIEHIGTEFEVLSDDRAVRIRVREGRIRLVGSRAALVASAGTELVAVEGEPVTEGPVATYGRDWLWIAALAPDYAIEGRPLSEFLQWVGRETGRRLEFADEHARRLAEQTILHGSVRGQRPMDALANVLATTSLAFELRGDSIVLHAGVGAK